MNNTDQAPAANTVAKELSTSPIEQLVSAAQSGSSEAFEEIQRIYSRRLYSTILSITRVPEDAEDALQDTFLRAFAALPEFEGRSTVYSWLTRIATNCALMILRKRRVRCEVSIDPPNDPADSRTHFEIADTAPNPEQIYDQLQRQARLAHAISNLEPILRTPIQIQMARGWTVKQIGRALAVSDAAVKTRLHRARQRLSKTTGLGPTRAYQPSQPCLGEPQSSRLNPM